MNVPPEGGGPPGDPSGSNLKPMTVLAASVSPSSGSSMPLITSISPGRPLASVSTPRRSPATSPGPARKRLKLDLTSTTGNPTLLKRKLFEWRTARLRRRTTSYRDHMAELFFLQHGTNVTESLHQFRRKPNQQFVNFLQTSSAPERVISEVQTAVIGQNNSSSLSNNISTPSSPSQVKRPAQSYSPHLTGGCLSPVKIGESQDTYNARQTASRPSQPSSIPPPTAPVLTSEQVGERMKQEGWVMRRVQELTRDGLWPARRLPQVAERPRPVSAWDLVLEEMRWMATDFAQERSWKKAAARVQSAACREHVVRKQEQEQALLLEMNSEKHKKMIARRLAEKIEVFWNDVESCYQYECNKRKDIYLGHCLSQQSSIVSEHPPLKRKHSDLISSTSPPPREQENGHVSGHVFSDSESSISEQESWEMLNLVQDSEINDLEADASQPLDQLVSRRYPGYEEDLRMRWENDADDDDVVSDWDSDSDADISDPPVNLDRTTSSSNNSEGYLQSLSNLLPKSVITTPPTPTSVSCDQLSALDWLVSASDNNLPSLMVNGDQATLAGLLSHLSPAGPHLLICPVSQVSSWTRALSHLVPSLTLHTYTGTPQVRRRSRETIFLSSSSPDVVITSYRTLFLDSEWFQSRAWSLLVLDEIQNVVSAGSSDQIRTLVSLRSAKRTLMMSGQLKETPIDLWNTLYLLFPSVYLKREESGADMEVEVEGTTKYTEIKEKLLTIVTGFCFQRSRSRPDKYKETILAVPLNNVKRKLYDDYLAQTLSHQDHNQRDLRGVCTAIQSLREICNTPVVSRLSSPESSRTLPSWCYLDKTQHQQWSNIQQYNPLENISLEHINLVFLCQEMTTTVLTSARLRSIKASKKLIQELNSSSSSLPPPPVPRHRLQLGLETLTRNIGGGWSLSGVGPGEGVTLVKAANGQVYRMSVSETNDQGKTGDEAQESMDVDPEVDGKEKLGAFHSESLDIIASFNHWRCDGFPLYGQDLVKSLTITNSLRPLRSRFRGQGYVNCLNNGDTCQSPSSDTWRYSTSILNDMCQVSEQNLGTILANAQPKDDGQSDNKMKALHGVIYPGYKEGKKLVVVTGLESLLPAIAAVCNKSGIRYCAVRASDSFTKQASTVSWWRLESRLTVLVLVGLEAGHVSNLDLSPADTCLMVDGSVSGLDTCVNHVVRLVAGGTVEEGLTRVETVRKILQDIKSKPDSAMLSKQTVTEIVSPAPDNGYTKKKEKGLSESEANVWNLFSACLGSSTEPAQSLLDLAELETEGEMVVDNMEDIEEETVDLVQWLQEIEPVKRYGMRLLRDNLDIRDGLCSTSEIIQDVEQSKYQWEEKFVEKTKEEEECYQELITYRKELVDREWRSSDGVSAGVWRPRGQMDVPDTMSPDSVFSGYSKQIIPDHQLPPVHVKKEKKAAPMPVQGVICQAMSPPTLSSQLSPSTSGQEVNKIKIKREDLNQPPSSSTSAPKSLFDRPRPVKMVPRRPLTALDRSSSMGNPPSAAGGTFQPLKPVLRGEAEAGPEWTIQEDHVLHQAVTSVQELSLTTLSTHVAHLVNWDMVSDMVNSVSWCYRSGKQCRARWDTNLVPREEGRITYDTTPKKLKKDKKLGLQKIGGGQAVKTGSLYRADNNNAISSTFSSRFETIKSIANKRTPTTTPLLVNPTLRNPKHAAVLAESGIDYDSPVSPIQVAASRAERIQASKARTQVTGGQPSAAQQQPQLPQSPVPRAAGASPAVSLPSAPAQAVVVGISQPLITAAGGQTVTRPAAVTALSVQDLLKNVSSGPAVMSTAGARQLPSGQILVTQAGQKTAVGQSGTVQVANQRLTPQQLALLKQQALNKKAQEQAALKARLSSAGAVSTAGGQLVTTTAAAGTSKVTVTGAVQNQALGRGQIMRQNVRNITDPEFKALLAKQSGVKVGQGGVVQVSANSMSAAQLQQLGIQVNQTSSAAAGGPAAAATLVKTVSAPAGVAGQQQGTSKAVTIAGVPAVNLQAAGGQLKAVAGRGTAIKGSPQQLQQLQLQKLQLLQTKQGLQGQRVALSTGGKGIPTQLIVPSGNKGLPAAVTVQQLQQIVKGAGLAGGQGQVIQGQQILSHVVKSGGQTVQARVIPVSGGAGGQRGQQTIQVVTATPQRQGGAPNVTINQMGGRQAGGQAGAAGDLPAGSHVKIQVPQGASQQQILSQISTALAGAGHGQNVSVAVRTGSQTGTSATVLQPAAVVQQQTVANPQQRQQQQQMVNLQLSVANNTSSNATSQQQQPNNSQPSNNSDV